MSRRVTVMLDDENDRTCRIIQAQQIKKTNDTYSFSKVVNELIKRGIKVKI